MPKLTISKLRNTAVNFLIPAEIKALAVSSFLEMVRDFDARMFATFIDNNVSLWRDLIMKVDNLADTLVEGVAAYSQWIGIANQDLILDWVLEARADLVPVLDTIEGRIWFQRQWIEIMKELGV